MSARLHTPLFGLDSETEIASQFHHAVHSKFAARYTSRYTPKAISRGEYTNYKANDIGAIAVFEDSATNALKGYDQGKSDAEFAQSQTAAAGRPYERPIFFAVDFDSSTDVDSIDSYFAGVASVLGLHKSGPYGSYKTCAHLLDRGFQWAWQTYAWSGGVVDGRAQVLQYSNDHIVGGVGVDYDQAWYEDYGQWEYVPHIADPNHYDWYPLGPHIWRGKKLYERAYVIEYDKLRQHPHLHKAKLAALRIELRNCADYIYGRASAYRKPGHTLPMEWSPFHRGERYKLLIRRSKGEAVFV